MFTGIIILLSAVPYPAIDPVIIRLGPVALRWYGVAYLLGFLLAYLILRRLAQRGHLGLSLAQVLDLLNWVVVGVIAGGRMGWWLIYHRGAALADPWYEPLAIWRGGMSFHGAVIGVVTALALWSWRQRVSPWRLADALALSAPLGLFLGRIGNFINAELVGRPTDLPWGVTYPGESFGRHPSQLYEAILEGPLLLVAVWVAWRLARLRPGTVAVLFLISYGLERFLVEFTREPDPQIGFVALGWLTMGQLLSVALVIAAAGLLRLRGNGSRSATEPSAFTHAPLARPR